jgi:hypothetical protein
MYNNAPTCIYRFDDTIIRESVVCALLKSQYWCHLKYFFGANETGIVHVYGKKKKTHDINRLSESLLHHRRGVDHMYFVMPNQQYSQLRNMYL